MQRVRLGVVAGRALGGAVHRNRAKRRLRACLRQYLFRLHGGLDMVFLARKPMDQASFSQISAAVQELLKRAGLLND